MKKKSQSAMWEKEREEALLGHIGPPQQKPEKKSDKKKEEQNVR